MCFDIPTPSAANDKGIMENNNNGVKDGILFGLIFIELHLLGSVSEMLSLELFPCLYQLSFLGKFSSELALLDEFLQELLSGIQVQ